MTNKVQMRDFTVHEEKRLTGAFRMRRNAEGLFELQVEAVVEKTRTQQTRTVYTTFRASRTEDRELIRIRTGKV